MAQKKITELEPVVQEKVDRRYFEGSPRPRVFLEGQSFEPLGFSVCSALAHFRRVRSFEALGFLDCFALAYFRSQSFEPLGFSDCFALMYFRRFEVLSP
jgi:hypothetical protein